MFRFAAPVLLCALALGGCASTKPAPRLVQFDEAEYAWSKQVGTGVIEGQAFLRTMGGDVKVAAGTPISLNPVTAYSTEWYNRFVIANELISDADDRALAYCRTVLGDGHGRFRFEGLPEGDYYLAAAVTWYVTESRQSGGMAHARVTVKDGQTTNAIVTRR